MRHRPLRLARCSGAYLCPARDLPPLHPALAFLGEGGPASSRAVQSSRQSPPRCATSPTGPLAFAASAPASAFTYVGEVGSRYVTGEGWRRSLHWRYLPRGPRYGSPQPFAVTSRRPAATPKGASSTA